MARENPAPAAGAVTWLVNPAEDDEAAELAFGRAFDREEDDVEMTPAKPSRTPGGTRTRKNDGGFEFFIKLLLPIAIGGGLGVLDGLNPRWWARLGFPARAFVLTGVAVVARKRGQLEVYGGATALAARYLALWAARKARVGSVDAPKTEEQQGQGGGATQEQAVGALGPSVDQELAAAARAMKADNQAMRAMPPPAADVGAIPMQQVRRGYNDMLIAAQNAA